MDNSNFKTVNQDKFTVSTVEGLSIITSNSSNSESLDMNKITEIEKEINSFEVEPENREASFDYCYNYFYVNRGESLLGNNLEKSCLVLGFYLASWGMLRGSSFLLGKSVKYFEETIKIISKTDGSYWEIDLDKYDEENIKKIIEIYHKIKDVLVEENRTHLTLVTKVLLGVFGFVPAYDSYFCQTFGRLYRGECGFTYVNEKSLKCIKDFYEKHKEIFDKLYSNTYTIDFLSAKKLIFIIQKQN
ncbi:MAG: hypothetical protein WCY89_09305 [Flavobacteriaceae bacterium]